MAEAKPVVLTNMCMIRDGEKVLVQIRNDKRWGGAVFPGGHIEDGESITDSVIREVFDGAYCALSRALRSQKFLQRRRRQIHRVPL